MAVYLSFADSIKLYIRVLPGRLNISPLQRFGYRHYNSGPGQYTDGAYFHSSLQSFERL